MHALIEKPLTLISAHAEELIELADQKNLVLMVGHTFEYNAAVHAIKELMDNGDLGQIYYLDSARLNLGLLSRDMNVLWDLAPMIFQSCFTCLAKSRSRSARMAQLAYFPVSMTWLKRTKPSFALIPTNVLPFSP